MTWILLLPTVVIFVLLFWAVVRAIRESETAADWTPLALTGVLAVVSSALTPFVWNVNPWLGGGLAVLVAGCALPLIATGSGWLRRRFDHQLTAAIPFAVLGIALALFAGIPATLQGYRQGPDRQHQVAAASLGPAAFSASLDRIRASLAGLEKTLGEETRRIEQTTSDTLGQLQGLSAEIQTLETQHQELLRQIETDREMAAMLEASGQRAREELRGPSDWDWALGSLFCILSAVLGAVLGRMLNKRGAAFLPRLPAGEPNDGG